MTHTFLDENCQLPGPRPTEKYSHSQQQYLDVEIVWQTTYFIKQMSRHMKSICKRKVRCNVNCHSLRTCFKNQKKVRGKLIHWGKALRAIPFGLVCDRDMNDSVTPFQIMPLIHNPIIMKKHHNKIIWEKLQTNPSHKISMLNIPYKKSEHLMDFNKHEIKAWQIIPF